MSEKRPAEENEESSDEEGPAPAPKKMRKGGREPREKLGRLTPLCDSAAARGAVHRGFAECRDVRAESHASRLRDPRLRLEQGANSVEVFVVAAYR